jgi:hypothetical protein
MNKKSKYPLRVDIAARAEAKLSVKAIVPTTSVGRLVDSLTDIIRPFTEARGLKADLLRVQREEVAIEIARRARQRLEIERKPVQAVPTKLLVPLIERGSCEAIDDEEMINRWANLLASAASSDQVQPRFVGILEELSGRQAACLESIAFSFADDMKYPDLVFVESSTNYGQYWVTNEISELVEKTLTDESKTDIAIDKLTRRFTAPGCYLDTITISIAPGRNFYSSCGPLQPKLQTADLDILVSLGLLQQVILETVAEFDAKKKAKAEVTIFYHHLTDLGVAFCQTCCRDKVSQLKSIENRQRPEDGEETTD